MHKRETVRKRSLASEDYKLFDGIDNIRSEAGSEFENPNLKIYRARRAKLQRDFSSIKLSLSAVELVNKYMEKLSVLNEEFQAAERSGVVMESYSAPVLHYYSKQKNAADFLRATTKQKPVRKSNLFKEKPEEDSIDFETLYDDSKSRGQQNFSNKVKFKME